MRNISYFHWDLHILVSLFSRRCASHIVLPITRVPGAPSFSGGCRQRPQPGCSTGRPSETAGFGDSPVQNLENDRERILMVEVDSQVIGMLVTEVVGISRIPEASIQPPP